MVDQKSQPKREFASNGFQFPPPELSSVAMSFTVPERELQFRAGPAGGPGGQHVNRASTRVEVRWDIASSPSISESQRQTLFEKLGSRIDSRGILRVFADERRSQLRNREAAVQRLNALVRQALRSPKPRKKTRPPPAAKEKRLGDKRRRSERKQDRRPIDPEA
ncbi:MAG: alternative ribosome rescue aminoacyl-tRNA hydrolase ArfB [Gemmatimonadales bacterium]|jgi:ribosome-associated protein